MRLHGRRASDQRCSYVRNFKISSISHTKIIASNWTHRHVEPSVFSTKLEPKSHLNDQCVCMLHMKYMCICMIRFQFYCFIVNDKESRWGRMDMIVLTRSCCDDISSNSKISRDARDCLNWIHATEKQKSLIKSLPPFPFKRDLSGFRWI